MGFDATRGMDASFDRIVIPPAAAARARAVAAVIGKTK
jgi:hypothetical protein